VSAIQLGTVFDLLGALGLICTIHDIGNRRAYAPVVVRRDRLSQGSPLRLRPRKCLESSVTDSDSYLSWRDTKAAILEFNRNANFKAVWKKSVNRRRNTKLLT
jgi:hypothetical protein